jgi:hypothetical protein
VRNAYRQVLGREASAQEVEQSLTFIDAMQSAKSGNDEKSAWARLFQALFASAEFRYKG